METLTFTDEMSAFRRIVLYATWFVCCLIGFAIVGFWAGLGVVAFGAAVVGLFRWLGKTQTITCAASGLTVKATSRRKGSTTTTVEWPKITSTRFYEQTVGDDESEVTNGHFEVLAGTNLILHVTDASKSFKEVIAAICDGTTHLDYRWVPRKEAQKDQVVATAGAYSKVRR